jgi:desulfoferrodoxin-like iron-binding protein
MKGFVCGMCGYVSINGDAPEKCPVCGAPKKMFTLKEDALKTENDEVNLSEKHTPVIGIEKKCNLIGGGCVDVNVKIGKTIHPMEKDHYIIHIDFYLNNEYISRVIFTPENLNPAVTLHLKANSGKLSVIELCNKHGAWIKEINL